MEAILVMDTNIEKIQKDLAWCKEQINKHNGALGFDIHPYPRSGLPGFMPYDDYMFVKKFEKRTKLDGKINLSTLSPGLYYGTRDNLDILPPDLMTNNILVDVTGANDHRIVVLTSQGQAKQWYMTWSGGIASNWKLRAAELRLFRGQVSLKAGTKISFTQTIPINDNNSSMTLYKVVGISPSGLWSITLPSFNGDLNAFVISGVKTEEPYQNATTKIKYRLTNESFTIDSIAGVVNGSLNNDPYTGMTIIAIDAIQ